MRDFIQKQQTACVSPAIALRKTSEGLVPTWAMKSLEGGPEEPFL